MAMSWCILRQLQLLLVFFVSVVSALHADEAGVIDWHHKLIGTPLEGCTFLHRPVAGSGALAYTLTDRNVLSALNLRDGGIGKRCLVFLTLVWRQLIQDPKLIRPLDGSMALIIRLTFSDRRTLRPEYDYCHDIRCPDRSSTWPVLTSCWISLGPRDPLTRLAK
jgi:hypothetical protein